MNIELSDRCAIRNYEIFTANDTYDNDSHINTLKNKDINVF